VDESDRSHLNYHPDYAVLTNLDDDHLDVYRNVDDLEDAFRQFILKMKATGHVIFCGHDSRLQEITQRLEKKINFGFSKKFTYGAESVVLDPFGSRFYLYEKGRRATMVSLAVPGKHNILNALAAIAVLRTFGLPVQTLVKGISEFKGVARRLEIKLNLPNLIVIDDYAHHPTAVAASLQAVERFKKPITAIFQPHRYSRTSQLARSFSKVFHTADHLILTDIYGAGEENHDHVNVQDLYQMVQDAGHPDVRYFPIDQITDALTQGQPLEGVVLFLGAGDITEVASEFTKRVSDSDSK